MVSHSVRWCHFPRLCLLFIVLCCSRLNCLRWKWSIRRPCRHCALANVNCHNIRNSSCSGTSAVLWGALMATAPSVHCTSTRKFKSCIIIYPFIQVLAVGKFLQYKSIKNFSSIWPYTFCIWYQTSCFRKIMRKIVTSDRHRHYTKSAAAYLCYGVCFLHFRQAVKV